MRKMTDKLKRHIWFWVTVKALFAMMLLTMFMWIFDLAFSNLFESTMPTSYWFEYESVTSLKTWYNKWEEIQLLTIAERHRGVEMQRQDTLYCDNPNYTVKYHTQVRPPEWTEYKSAGKIRSAWTYYLLPPEEETSCRVCWYAIGTTPLGYKKIEHYCTDYFSVNL